MGFVFVLGVITEAAGSRSLDDCDKIGIIYFWGGTKPANAPFSYGNVINLSCTGDASILYQIAYYRSASTPTFCFRTRDGGLWSDWKEISTDLPSFYKNYNNLASLLYGIGEQGINFRQTQKVNPLQFTAANTSADTMIEFIDGDCICKLGIRRPISLYGLSFYDGQKWYKINMQES